MLGDRPARPSRDIPSAPPDDGASVHAASSYPAADAGLPVLSADDLASLGEAMQDAERALPPPPPPPASEKRARPPVPVRQPSRPSRAIPDAPTQEGKCRVEGAAPGDAAATGRADGGEAIEQQQQQQQRRGPPSLDLDLPHAQPPTAGHGHEHAPAVTGARPALHAADSARTLTPLRAHYLKKALIELEFERELDALTTAPPSNISTFSYLGPPFSAPPAGAPRLALPFLQYVFRTFVVSFPFLAAAPRGFFSEKLQPFMASLLARNLSPAGVLDDDPAGAGDTATRQKIRIKMQRNLALFLGSATKLVEKEEVVRLTQADLDRLEELAKRRQAREAKLKGTFEVNIICVRSVVEKGRMRSRAHEEFIIRTRRSDAPDVFVSRRYGDFKTLCNELRNAHPQATVPLPPVKDRTAVGAPTSPTGASPTSPLSRQDTNFSVNSGESSYPTPAAARSASASRLSREKNRLTLRAYLHGLMASSTLASSPVLRSFLLSGPTRLTPDEEDDARRREEADTVRDEGRKRFAREVSLRVEGLRGALRDVKGDAMGQDGLTHIFATIKTTQDVKDLPQSYQAVMEWARISLASTVFQQLVASDTASETLASLKRIHGLMPYFMLKAALKISNPVGMIRTVLDLFMAQPFGGRSLLQRMFTSSLAEEVKALEEDIEAVKDKIDDPVMCEKIRAFVYAPREIQAVYKADAAAEKMNVLAVVLRSGEEPALSRPQLHRVQRAHRAHQVYLRDKAKLHDSDDDDGPDDDDAWLFEDLTVLTKLYARLRDREQLIELIFEGTTADLLKDIITIFYAPLAQVYKAASIADSIGDLQQFITDLIKTVEGVDEVTQNDPQKTVKIFVDLIQRHEQSFYTFVHKVHSKGESLFDNLMRWIELFLTVVREGATPEPLSLEFLLPHVGVEREMILREVDAIALYHYKLKVAYEEKLRRRFGKAQEGRSDADLEDEAAQKLVAGVVDELSFGELIQGDAMDAAAQSDGEDDSDDDDDSSSEEDSSDEFATADESEESAQHRTQPPSRSRTISHRPPPSAPAQRMSHDQPHPPQPPPRLKSSKSLTSLRKAPRRSQSETPPIPSPSGSGLLSPRNKSLPASPAPGRSSHEEPRRSQAEQRGPPPRALRKRPRQEDIKAPELHHIPNLLPIFVEMIGPGLRPPQQQR